MNRFKNEIKVGITIIVAILVAFIGFRILQDIPFFGRSFELHSHYERVDGVTPGTSVYKSGVKVGSVRYVEFVNGDRVRVDMSFSDIEGIPQNSIASIEAIDMLGTRAIIIHSSSEQEYIEDGGEIEGRYDEGITGQIRNYGEEIVPKISESSDNLNAVLSQIDMLLRDGGRENLDDILTNLNRTSSNVDRLVEDKNQDLADAIDRFNSILVNIDTLSSGRKDEVDRLMANLEQTTNEMNEITRELNELSAGLNQTVDKINRGEGSLGMMINDPSLYNNLDSLAYGLNSTVQRLNDDPRHFLRHIRLVDIF